MDVHRINIGIWDICISVMSVALFGNNNTEYNMKQLTTTLILIRSFNPCGQDAGSDHGYAKLVNYLGEDWPEDKEISLLLILESNGFYDCLWALRATIQDSTEVSVRLAFEFSRRVLYLFEEKFPDDDLSRKSIETAEAWLECTEEERGNIVEAAAEAAEAWVTEAWEAWEAATEARAAEAAREAAAEARAAEAARVAAWAAEAAWKAWKAWKAESAAEEAWVTEAWKAANAANTAANAARAAAWAAARAAESDADAAIEKERKAQIEIIRQYLK